MEYYERDSEGSSSTVLSLTAYPDHLAKKINVLNYFKTYMDQNLVGVSHCPCLSRSVIDLVLCIVGTTCYNYFAHGIIKDISYSLLSLLPSLVCTVLDYLQGRRSTRVTIQSGSRQEVVEDKARHCFQTQQQCHPGKNTQIIMKICSFVFLLSVCILFLKVNMLSLWRHRIVFQINFFDHTKLVVNCELDLMTFVDKDRVAVSYRLEDLALTNHE